MYNINAYLKITTTVCCENITDLFNKWECEFIVKKNQQRIK